MGQKKMNSIGIFVLVSLSVVSCSRFDNDAIVRVSRQNNSGTYVYFRNAVIGKGGEFKLGSIDQSGSKDVVELVSKTPLAIGYSGMAYATPEVKMLKIFGGKEKVAVAPNVANVQNGSYPIARPLFIYTKEEPKGAVKEYIDWIYSEEGQKIVEDVGYVPVETKGPAKLGSSTLASIQVSGSDTMVNLAQQWAEIYGSKYGNNKIQVSGGGSGVGIAGLMDGTVDMANTSRKMKPKELALAKEKNGVEPKEFIVGADAVAVYVHKNNVLNEISLEQLKEIYGSNGAITHWPQLTPQVASKVSNGLPYNFLITVFSKSIPTTPLTINARNIETITYAL
mgnify:CR=1 FL=1